MDAELIRSWEEGVAHFNGGRFYEAHEAWERGWRGLTPERKRHIQGMIQAAAVFHLLELGRAPAARSLAGRALEKLQNHPEPPFPRIEIVGLEAVLAEIAQGSGSEIRQPGLRAELLLSPRS